jgi:PIN domain nuclease of toxin-antitoxin system
MGAVGYLLDTHTFLWSVRECGKLSSKARKVIEDVSAPLYISSASAYEIMNKYRIGKLPGFKYEATNFFDILHTLGANELSISMNHAYFAGETDWAHRDPFDRLLAAQAYIEKLTLITNDPVFQTFPSIMLLW